VTNDTDVARALATGQRDAIEDAPPDLAHSVRARMYAEAERFFTQRLRGSWVPGYLERRGLNVTLQGQWNTGYAPRGWTTLITHLRGQGYSDVEIHASGLAFHARRGPGNLVDQFRDRAVWPIRAEDGTTVAFIGRAAPGSQDEQDAKYINNPDCDAYRKGHLLFGLYESRKRLAAGARPVVVEGVPDAIAVTAADSGRYAGVAACGTALTPHHAAALARHADLAVTGVMMAMDGDQAGRRGMVAAYHVLTTLTDQIHAVVFPEGRDPAQLLRTVGPAALIAGMEQRARPLADLVTDAHIDQLSNLYEGVRSYDGGTWLHDDGGKFFLVYDTAKVIAQMPPTHVARQITRLAQRFDLDHQQVTSALITAVTDVEEAPKRLARWSRTDIGPSGPTQAATAPHQAAAAHGFPTNPTRRLSAPTSQTMQLVMPATGHMNQQESTER
jgi:DNA primase catalytic core